ncbi:ABC transporter ATP-binding protein [Gordonia sp. LSe1-13]|uniref:ABC transporter ATP-binding protein n=1 Tax=Gordonia sesuvii TaxID=3116777 RepID=A0ABU7MA97_9ACTN|nr:ABC transporter ATP-binding protein [Gordonia sp. LSe1-13]
MTIDLDVPGGTTLAVMGPNGAGKSTALSVVAGLRRTPRSEVHIGDVAMQDGRRFVPPHRRSVVLLAQRPRLFPHLNVRRNVAFGPAAARLGRAEVAARTEKWLAAAGVEALADRMSHQLSGGQAQRVAIARALAAEPDVLLLDEPFAALDVSVAQQIRSLLRDLLADRVGSTILVTHDLIDAVSLASDVVVMDHGRAVDAGPTREVLTSPGHPFTASLSGLNLFVGTFAGKTVDDGAGRRVVGVAADQMSAGQTCAAAFAPRAVAVYLEAPHGSPRNELSATVTDVLPRGDHAVVRTLCGRQMVDAEVTWAAVADLGLRAGLDVTLVVKASEVRVYGVTSEERPNVTTGPS